MQLLFQAEFTAGIVTVAEEIEYTQKEFSYAY